MKMNTKTVLTIGAIVAGTAIAASLTMDAINYTKLEIQQFKHAKEACSIVIKEVIDSAYHPNSKPEDHIMQNKPHTNYQNNK